MARTLTELLLELGVDLDPTATETDKVLADEEVLKDVVGIWNDHQDAIKSVIQARVQALATRVLDGNGVDGVVYKQAMVEVAAILQDFKKYGEELAKRAAKQEKPEGEKES